MQYRAFCDELRLLAKMQQFQLSGNFKICFYFEMPARWSEKKKKMMQGLPHRQTPDLDNILKAVNDALLEQDKIIYRIEASKWWADSNKIIIQNL
jgi:Holliday junction resolvase RusA-like endonuclease